MSTAKKLIDTIKDNLGASQQVVSPTYLKLVKVHPLQPINSKKQHELALKVLEQVINYLNETKSEDKGIELYLKTLSELVSDYEKNKFKFTNVSGSEMLAYIMDLQGLSQVDLSKELGGQPVVSRILNGDRELNLRQIKSLAKRFNVSAEVFID